MPQSFNADALLRRLAEIRRGMPLPAGARADTATSLAGDVESLDDFDRAAVAEALDSMASELRAVVDDAMQSAYAQAIEAYYTAEELSRDPGHAHLTAHVEAMREAHLKSYRRPIPPRRR
jgi:hypothetical protein